LDDHHQVIASLRAELARKNDVGDTYHLEHVHRIKLGWGDPEGTDRIMEWQCADKENCPFEARIRVLEAALRAVKTYLESIRDDYAPDLAKQVREALNGAK
jgi:hypothetical protein